ncbi:hypothetical protein HK105_203644 [Polyrhizophydium stewartii]|uniref:Uncharacterized protein n=1 Tax=Polyrhizophydium stewartii TaxID=2732419 RepID=A0ABR4NBF4_9FUNG
MARYEAVPQSDTSEAHAISIQDSPKRPSPTSLGSTGHGSSTGGGSPIKLGAVSPILFDPTSPSLPPRFVKLLGVPPPNSDGSVTSPPIELGGSDERNHVMDVLDADNEDPFTLETLETLIHNHARKGVDFILARVTTVDPNDETRFYYSYYAAHHINKVLFRTQPEEGLLHRMRAKNPLNNMTIVGDVHYYVVTAALAQARMQDLAKMEKPRSPLAKVGASIIKAIFPGESTAPAGSAGPASTGRIRNHFRSKSGDTPVFVRFFERAGIVSPSKKPTLHLIARPEAFESGEIEPRATASMQAGAAPPSPSGAGPSQTSATPGVPVETPVDRLRGKARARADSSRRNSFDDAYRDPLPAANVAPRIAVITQSPTNTQAELDLHRHRKVRSFAYSNDHTGSMSLRDWVHMQAVNKSRSTQGSPERSSPGQGSPREASNPRRPPREGREGELEESTIAVAATPGRESPHARQPAVLPEFYYEATYYASDDDFLMKSSVRAYFKENALESTDAVLFTITTTADGRNSDQHPALLNFMYSVAESEADARAFANFDTSKILKWLIVVYAIFAIVVIKFFVPVAYVYVVAFVLIFLFGLLLIVCI